MDQERRPVSLGVDLLNQFCITAIILFYCFSTKYVVIVTC